jgi:hypothetical protein
MMAVLAAALAGSAAQAVESPGLATLLGAAEDSFPARVAAIRALGKSLSGDEINALYGFLNRKAGEDKAQPGELNALKNDVANALKMQKTMPADLPARLMAMFGDRSHDEVWRDYCIQHLGDVYPSIADTAVRAQVRRVLWSAADERKGSIPGTALIALSNQVGQEGFGKARIAAKALEMVREPSCGEPARITALQICANLGERAVLPDARRLAADGSTPIRVSAIACVGTLGDASDLEWLRKDESASDIRLKTAARAAMGKLRERK